MGWRGAITPGLAPSPGERVRRARVDGPHDAEVPPGLQIAQDANNGPLVESCVLRQALRARRNVRQVLDEPESHQPMTRWQRACPDGISNPAVVRFTAHWPS